MFQGNASAKTDTEENTEIPVRIASSADETCRHKSDKSVLSEYELGRQRDSEGNIQGTFVGISLEFCRGKGGHITFETG
jgi:hypothetical protein